MKHSTFVSVLHLLAAGVLALPNSPLYGYPSMPTISYHFPNTTYLTSYESSATYASPSSTPVYVSPIYQQPTPYPTGLQVHSSYPISYYTPPPYQTSYSYPIGSTPPYQTSGLPYYTPTGPYTTEIPYTTPAQKYSPIYQSSNNQYMSSYPSSSYQTTASTCPSSGLDINNPGGFVLWTWAPGFCDLDNKPVSGTVALPESI